MPGCLELAEQEPCRLRCLSNKGCKNFPGVLTLPREYDNIETNIFVEVVTMEHIKTIETRNLCDSAKNGGCGECQTSCQSACKTSCGIANQKCESTKESK